MSEQYRRRFTPQNKEHKQRALPQILPAKVNLNSELEVKINTLVISAKKPPHQAAGPQFSGPLQSTKPREKSAGARLDESADRRPASLHRGDKTAIMLGTRGEKYVGPPPKDFSPQLRAAAGPKSPAAQNGATVAEKRGRSSHFGQDRLYSSFYNDLPGAANSIGWPRPSKTHQPSLKTEANQRQADLVANKSVNSLLGSGLQVASKLRTQPLHQRANETLQRNFGTPSGGPIRATLKAIPRHIPRLEPPRISTTSFQVIKSYAVNTCKGLVRPYNEDRVSIILNMIKPEDKKSSRWPVCSFFGVARAHQVFDGHGGHTCSDFLRDNLHKFIINDAAFPENPPQAIHNGFLRADEEFLRLASSRLNDVDISGSCACVLLVVEDKGYVGNSGDSRAVLSQGFGASVQDLSCDHKPNHPPERARIESVGGSVYK